jgi:multiple sugar transport system substrate-binding protein
MFLIAVLVISSMLLSACGGESPTATTGTGATGGAAAATDTPAAAGAAATDTTAPAAGGAATDTPAAAGGAATDTPAAAGGAATDTPAAAGGGATSSTFDPTKYKKNAIESGATLRVASWGDTSEQQVNRDALKRFNQIYPDVKITYEPIPDQYDTKLLAQIKGGSQPDVFYVDPGTGYQLIPAGVLLDLTPALAETGRSKDDYFPSLINTFIGKDGKVYGLPKDFGSLAIFYNTDMVKNPPKAGWTQDDFANFVKENNSGSGQTQVFGFSADPDFERWGAFALANGAKIIDNNKCALNSDIGVATLDWWYGMYKDKIATIPADVGAGWSGEALAKKRIASTAQGGWLIPFLNDPKAAFGVKYDAAPLPVGKTGGKADLLFFNAWGASAKSKFPKAAAALTLFLASRENEGTILQTGFALPTLTGFENDPYFQGSGVTNKISALLYQTAQYGVPDYYGGINDPKIKKAFADATQRVYAKQQTSKQALDQACQEVDPLLAAAGQ